MHALRWRSTRFSGANPRARDFWDRWQRDRNARSRPGRAGQKWVDWGDHPRIRELILNRVFGPPPGNLFECLGATFPQLRTGHALSLCCGDGGFERQLIQSGVLRRVTGMDIAPVRIASAAAGAGPDEGLDFRVGDANLGDFGSRQYDAVIAKAALHHIECLEAALQGIRRVLKPGGCLIAIDYFGPTRFQWTDIQLETANRFLIDEVAEALRLQPDGSIYSARRPSVAEMIASDPSEAARSGEILALLRRHFPRLDVRDIGGTILQLIFSSSIVNNFDESNPAHNCIVEKAFALEQSLLVSGAIDADFKFVAAYGD